MSIAPHRPPITPDAPGHHVPASPQPPFRPGPLGRLARLAFRYRGRTVLLWLAAFVVALGLSTAFAGAFNADYSAPGSDSAAAQDLLTTRFPASANDTVTLVAHSTQPVTHPMSGPGSTKPSTRPAPLRMSPGSATPTRTRAPSRRTGEPSWPPCGSM